MSPSYCPLTCVLGNQSIFHFKSATPPPPPLSLTSPSSSTYQSPLPASWSIVHFISPTLPLLRRAHPGSLGPLKCIISSKRYPSALTSVLAGCLPSPLNGLINPSWFLDGLDFIVSRSPLSSCSSLILNVILLGFNMSAFFWAQSVWSHWEGATWSRWAIVVKSLQGALQTGPFLHS